MDVAKSDYAKDRFVRLGENDNISLVEWNHDMNHVHILFKAHPIFNLISKHSAIKL
mgnify:CR=1 FL=1